MISNKTQEIRHAQDIFDKEPLGALGIAAKLKRHPKTVERWSQYGVPDYYWDFLHKNYGITPYELFRFNAKIKGYKA